MINLSILFLNFHFTLQEKHIKYKDDHCYLVAFRELNYFPWQDYEMSQPTTDDASNINSTICYQRDYSYQD